MGPPSHIGPSLFPGIRIFLHFWQGARVYVFGIDPARLLLSLFEKIWAAANFKWFVNKNVLVLCNSSTLSKEGGYIRPTVAINLKGKHQALCYFRVDFSFKIVIRFSKYAFDKCFL